MPLNSGVTAVSLTRDSEFVALAASRRITRGVLPEIEGHKNVARVIVMVVPSETRPVTGHQHLSLALLGSFHT